MNDFISRDINKIQNRRTGKTFIAANFVKQIHGILICFNHEHAKQVKSEYGIETIDLESVMNGKLLGSHNPTFYDQECIARLEHLMNKKIQKLECNIKELKEENHQLKLKFIRS